MSNLDLGPQGRGRRNAEDEIETVRPAEVDDLGAAIVAVGADENVRGGPVGPDRLQQTTEGARVFLRRWDAWPGAE